MGLAMIAQLRLMVIVGMCACIGGAWYAILCDVMRHTH